MTPKPKSAPNLVEVTVTAGCNWAGPDGEERAEAGDTIRVPADVAVALAVAGAVREDPADG